MVGLWTNLRSENTWQKLHEDFFHCKENKYAEKSLWLVIAFCALFSHIYIYIISSFKSDKKTYEKWEDYKKIRNDM